MANKVLLFHIGSPCSFLHFPNNDATTAGFKSSSMRCWKIEYKENESYKNGTIPANIFHEVIQELMAPNQLKATIVKFFILQMEEDSLEK